MTARRAALGAMALVLVLGACGTSSGSDPADRTTAPGSNTVNKKQTLGKGAVDCGEVDPLLWKVTGTNDSEATPVSARILRGRIPRPPTAAPGRTTPNGVESYGTPGGYLKVNKVEDPVARTKMMEAAGFVQGTFAEFDDPSSSFSVQSMVFRDTPAAATFLRSRLPVLCAEAQGSKVLPVNDDSGLIYLDASGAPHAVLVMGNQEFTLSLCDCTKGDRVEATKVWAEAWLEVFHKGKPKPASYS